MDKNLFGLNPDFKEFLDKRPDLTVLGLAWTIYWRMFVVVIIVEAIAFLLFILLGGAVFLRK